MSQEAVHLITDLFQNNTYDMTGCLIHCSYNGICKFNEITKTHNCECLNHYTGTKCETNLNKCSSFPCLNNGKCIDVKTNETYTFKCNCTSHYYGAHCENAEDQCKSKNCSSNGYCFKNKMTGLAECKCFSKYFGDSNFKYNFINHN